MNADYRSQLARQQVARYLSERYDPVSHKELVRLVCELYDEPIVGHQRRDLMDFLPASWSERYQRRGGQLYYLPNTYDERVDTVHGIKTYHRSRRREPVE